MMKNVTKRGAVIAASLILSACAATTGAYSPFIPRRLNPDLFEPVHVLPYVEPSVIPSATSEIRRIEQHKGIVHVYAPKPKKHKTVVRYAVSTEKARGIAQRYALSRVGQKQFNCLYKLWMKESGWNYRDLNRSSGAYGIPQALPGSKMASAGDDWRTNPITQVRWGIGYINGRYGSPCGAWAYWQTNRWY